MATFKMRIPIIIPKNIIMDPLNHSYLDIRRCPIAFTVKNLLSGIFKEDLVIAYFPHRSSSIDIYRRNKESKYLLTCPELVSIDKAIANMQVHKIVEARDITIMVTIEQVMEPWSKWDYIGFEANKNYWLYETEPAKEIKAPCLFEPMG